MQALFFASLGNWEARTYVMLFKEILANEGSFAIQHTVMWSKWENYYLCGHRIFFTNHHLQIWSRFTRKLQVLSQLNDVYLWYSAKWQKALMNWFCITSLKYDDKNEATHIPMNIEIMLHLIVLLGVSTYVCSAHCSIKWYSGRTE